MSNLPVLFPPDIVAQIMSFIDAKSEYLGLNLAADEPLGTKVFDLLAKQCTVVYFPIEDISEENDAFLLTDIPMKSGDLRNIVFINTFQTAEKQVFAAAHELGHLLNIGSVIKAPSDVNEEEFNERLVNRFAAEILMPRKQFWKYICDMFTSKYDSEEFSFRSLLGLIVDAMNHFSVPYNAVAIRLVELDIINEEQGRFLVDGNKDLPSTVLKSIVKTIISESNYENLQSRNMKKEITGLATLLEEAEKTQAASQIQINRLRKCFNIPYNNQWAFLEKHFDFNLERG